METRMIGYRGQTCSEIMLYVSRILYQMGLRVLLCDYSHDKGLRGAMPFNDALNGDAGVYDYRGVFYSDGLAKEDIGNYDVVLVNFGFLKLHEHMERCHCLHYVTNMDKANTDRLLAFVRTGNKMSHLLIGGVVRGGISVYAMADEIMQVLSISTCSLIRLNKKDEKVKVLAQYNNRFKFDGISKGLQDYLYFCARHFPCGAHDDKAISKAIKSAMRGG